ncbi:hypothetical protein [Blastococcus sp. CCUG 61487]|uniref:hypothetical protein n=1 Tax=Blastococcus sp. CCUG 61487 TaxID=1840703 RepID=UPI0010C00266|nr:hypothetical protein [Blastococcus sp. CCUG 61487]
MVATLRRLVGVVHVTCTDATTPTVVALLEAAGVIVRMVPVAPDAIGWTRREILAWTVDTHPDSWVLHSDLDHLLDCVAHEDLAFLGEAGVRADGCVVIGRAEEHVGKGPRELVLTEGVCNELARVHFGMPTADFMFGMQLLGPEAAAHVARKSICRSQATDIEWPLLVRAAGLPVSFRPLVRTWFDEDDAPSVGPAGQAARWHRRLRIAADVAELLSGEAGACR